MSTPIYNGGLLGAIDDQNRPYIFDDGNWSMQGTSEVPAYRAVALYVNTAQAFGYRPLASREPYAQALEHPGVFTRENLLAWRGPILAAGSTVEMILTGGNRYLGWGDTAGEDWMEWGSLSPTTLKPIVATTGLMVVPGDTIPPDQPPPDVDIVEELAEMADNVAAEMELATAQYFAWRRDNPGEVDQLLAYLGYYVQGDPVAPPSLKTHFGRAMCGIVQNGITCQNNL